MNCTHFAKYILLIIRMLNFRGLKDILLESAFLLVHLYNFLRPIFDHIFVMNCIIYLRLFKVILFCLRFKKRIFSRLLKNTCCADAKALRFFIKIFSYKTILIISRITPTVVKITTNVSSIRTVIDLSPFSQILNNLFCDLIY